MFRYLILFSFFLLASFSKAQVILEKEVHDFGQLLRSSQNWVDIPIRNDSDKEAYIFRVESAKGFEIKFSNKKIAPGKTEYIRIAYTPSAEGNFKYKLPVYTSSWQEPKNLTIKGESTFAESALIPCLSFGAESQVKEVDLFVEVVDSNGVPIKDALVTIKALNSEEFLEKTNNLGQVSKKLPYGSYYIRASKENSSLDTVLQVNAINSVLILSLNYQEPPENEVIALSEELVLIAEEVMPVVKELFEDSTKPDKPEQYPDFSLSEYKPNNLVFLVDVSTSMKKNGKMDLLKEAMIELLNLLRPVDRFALISYSTDTEVLIATQSHLDKKSCIEAIRSLEPGGSTAGARALTKAREIANRQFIEDGNNEVLLATDGAFNEGVEKALKESRRLDRDKIMLTVLGIKCGKFTEGQMSELVSQGKGSLILIKDENDAGELLVEEIKKNARY